MASTTSTGAAALLASVGLMADGPGMWGRPVPAKGPGLYIVELPGPQPSAPIELTRVGKWIERVPTLRLDGGRPTSKELAARLAAFWLPTSPVLYAGATGGSLGGRVSGLYRHLLGDRRPHSDGQWLFTLRGLDQARLWWAETSAVEEYLDAVLDAFAASIGELPPGRPAGSLLIPWANSRRPTGERQVHGITGSVLPDEAADAPPAPGSRVVELPPGDADGARADERSTGTTRRSGDPASVAPRGTETSRTTPRAPQVPPPPPKVARTVSASTGRATASKPRPTASPRVPTKYTPPPEPVHVSPEALARMREELDDLTRVRRPDVVARIKSARELGDLRENAEYQAAREEQSFLEGRVRTLEERLRNVVVIEARGEDRVHMGSTVTVVGLGVVDDEPVTYTIVGSTEADPAAGRISAASPVGAALLGAAAGDEVQVRTPRGAARYRVERVT